MPKYVTLYNWTEQGIRGFRDTVERAKAAESAVAKMGGKLTDIYWTTGAYDLVAIADFPDDETAAAFNLKLAALGNVRSTTMRAFDRDAMAKIIAKSG